MTSGTLIDPDATAEPQAEAPRRRGRIAVPLLLQYWAVVLRWKWLILAIMAASVAAAVIVTLLMTPQYTAKSRIEISRELKKVANVSGVDSEEVGRDIEFYQTQYSLLSARTLAERVARDLELDRNDRLANALGTKPVSVPGDTKESEQLRNRLRERNSASLLLANVRIQPIARSSLVDIAFTSSDPRLSAEIVNSWAKEFIAASIARRYSSTADARRFLEARLEELRARLQQSESALVGYATQTGIVPLARRETQEGRTTTERTLVSDDLESLNRELAQATAARVAAEAKRRAAANTGGAAEAQANASLIGLRQRRAEVASEYAKVLVKYDPQHPDAQALKQQVDALDGSIRRERVRITGGLDAEYQSAADREAQLRQQVANLSGRLNDQQRASIQYNIYQRDVDTNRQLYEGLLARYKEIGVAGVDANNIAIVDPAILPTGPSSPRPLINLAIGLLVGLGLCGLTVFGLEQVDEGLRIPPDVERLLGLPLLGSVPMSESDDVAQQLVDTKSALSEAYLTVRSNLAFSTDHGVPKSIAITSTRAREGKSITSMALSLVLGRTGKRVLLIDADMRSPSVHHLFGVPNEAGLSNFLAGEDDWHQFVRPTGFPGVTVMAAGPVPPSAGELLSGDRPARLIEEALRHFDHVLVDAPPMLGLADAPLIARVVEGMVFVIEAEGVSVRGIENAVERLRGSHARIYGAVLTKLRRRQAGFGYGYGYGYGYDYSYGKD